MTKHQRKPQRKKSPEKKSRDLSALEHELEISFEKIYRNSFNPFDTELVHAVGKIATVRNLFAKAHEDDIRYIPKIWVEIIQV